MNEENKSGSSSGENVPPSSNWQMPNGSVLQKNRNEPKPNGSLPNGPPQSSPNRSEPNRSRKLRKFPMAGSPVNGKNTQIMTPTLVKHVPMPLNPRLDNPFPLEQVMNHAHCDLKTVKKPWRIELPPLNGPPPNERLENRGNHPAPMQNGQLPNRKKHSVSSPSQSLRKFPMDGFPVNRKNTQIMTSTAVKNARIPINPTLDNPFPREQVMNRVLAPWNLQTCEPLQTNYLNKLTGNLPRKTPDRQEIPPTTQPNSQLQSSPNRLLSSPSPLSQNQ